jgi:hypothetical protein
VIRIRRERGRGFDRFLLLAGLVALAASLLLPDAVDWTIMMAWRWGGVAAALLLLAMPRPMWLGARSALVLAALGLGAFLAATGVAWRDFAREEMAGFEDCLIAVPRGADVLGLDASRRSSRFYVSPTFQMFAYAAVERGAKTNFSFVDLPSSLVVRADRDAASRWTRELEWHPERVQPRDVAVSDFVLLHAEAPVVSSFRTRFGDLRVVAGAGRWHLLASVSAHGEPP